MNAISKIFQRYDLRVTGRVSPHDFKAVLRVICGEDITSRDIEELLRFTETKHSRSSTPFCDYVKFLSVLRNPSSLLCEENNTVHQISDLLCPFYEFDMAGAGVLTRRNFYSIIAKHPILYVEFTQLSTTRIRTRIRARIRTRTTTRIIGTAQTRKKSRHAVVREMMT